MEPNYTPHGHCLLWNMKLVNFHRVPDFLIALSYFLIPLILAYALHHQRKELDLLSKLVLFVSIGFILTCGSTHLMNIWNMAHTDYWAEGWVKVICSCFSITAVGILARFVFTRIALIKSSVVIVTELAALKKRNAELEAVRISNIIPETLESRMHKVSTLERAEAAAISSFYDILKKEIRGH